MTTRQAMAKRDMLGCHVARDKQFYAVLTGTYVLSRALLVALGVRFSADYGWQHFHDVELLKHRLWESLLHTHAFTPFINLLAGVVLKASEQHAVAIYQVLYLALGGAFINALGYLLDALGFRRAVAIGTALAFSLTPGFVYFENLLHYEFIAAALLTVAAALFHRALSAPTWWRWFAIFLVCAAIAYVRTTFHLVWLLAMVVLAVAFQRQKWRAILSASLFPIVLVTALYAKNQYMFGIFGTSSNFGANLAYPTIRQLTKTELARWIKEGKIHPVSAVNVYAGPEEYAAWIDVSQKRGVPVLDDFRRSNGQVNYNHWSYGEVSKLRMRDNRYYLSQRKWAYARTVLKSLAKFFRPTSTWHPHDKKGPHAANRKVLGGWERLYNGILHTFPTRPLGLYVIVIPAVLVAAWRALHTVWRARFEQHAREKTLLVMAFICLYVPVLSCLVTTAELSRYRLMIEAFLWLLCLSLVPLRGRPSALQSRESP
jgi:4-amino-4-deoxy-L-arabinose transferase-like glycosyltransferase